MQEFDEYRQHFLAVDEARISGALSHKFLGVDWALAGTVLGPTGYTLHLKPVFLRKATPPGFNRCTQVELSPQALTAAVWNGEGLPPIGCECEANFKGEWVKFELRYYGEYYVIFKTAFEVQRTRLDFDTCGVKFRPLRTAEQLAAEAREAEVDRLCKVVMAHPRYPEHNRNIDCSAAMRLAVEVIVDNQKFATDA
jgi:hypothetical protein